jgi:hypothetical protein
MAQNQLAMQGAGYNAAGFMGIANSVSTGIDQYMLYQGMQNNPSYGGGMGAQA